jgi:hypothetical protein
MPSWSATPQCATIFQSKGPLRDRMSVDDAAAIVWTAASPEVRRLLRAERGWTAERYRDWLADTHQNFAALRGFADRSGTIDSAWET